MKIKKIILYNHFTQCRKCENWFIKGHICSECGLDPSL